MVGPIDFGDSVPHTVPSTEMGGADGLIQPSVSEVNLKAASDGMDIGHELTPAEVLGIMRRRAGEPVEVTVRNEGELDSMPVVDPHTGRTLADDDSKDVTGKSARDVDLSNGMIQ